MTSELQIEVLQAPSPELVSTLTADENDWERLDDCVLAYETDFAEGAPKPLDSYLPDGMPLLRHATLVELIKVDLELRAKSDVPPSLHAYCARYPELGTPDDLPPDLIYEAYRMAQRRGERVAPEEFRERFPRQYRDFLSLVDREHQTSTAIRRMKPAWFPGVGETFDDFEIVRLLGEGSFAKVFLARQISLGREVALKVAVNRGSEARTLAALEHDHIVRVFSESVDRDRQLRLLCMQYVAGTTLHHVVAWLNGRDLDEATGRTFVEAIDALSGGSTAFHPSSLRDRELLEQADFVEAVCQLGARLADALSEAHSQNILHRDIKPANILLNQYGRPYLADFNLSFDAGHLASTTANLFGGSLAYMSPEHLDAFNSRKETTPEAVDRRSDIYSLGVVLFETAVGCRPWEHPETDPLHVLDAMADERRSAAPSMRTFRRSLPAVFDIVIRKCLEPEPDDRYQSAEALSGALDGVRTIQQIERRLPAIRFEALTSHPFLMLLVLVLLPHFAGSCVNIVYNNLQIVSALSATQQSTFLGLVLGYNAVVYPICLWLLWRIAVPVYRTWRTLDRGEIADRDEMATARARVVSWPTYAIAISCLGWLPGGVLFPVAIHHLSGPVSAAVFCHFVISFSISGLIALTYSYFAVQFSVLRVFYPRLWSDPHAPQQRAREELRAVPRRLRLFQLFAGAIPLLGAILLLVSAPAELQMGSRLLITSLMIAGVVGLCCSIGVAAYLMQTFHALTGLGTDRQLRNSQSRM